MTQRPAASLAGRLRRRLEPLPVLGPAVAAAARRYHAGRPPPPIVLDIADGWCPICEGPARFTARHPWLRDNLICAGAECRSIPRERALMLAIEGALPGWREARIHESSPGDRGVSRKMARQAAAYSASQFFPGREPGETVDGWRNETLEALTFADAAFDLILHQDVMEHVNRPDLVMRETARVLAPGGLSIFTTPTYKGRAASERRAIHHPDGPEHLAPPEYHGNPVSGDGALVTFHFGHDFAGDIHRWSGLEVTVERRVDRRRGVLGEFLEVYVCRKPG